MNLNIYLEINYIHCLNRDDFFNRKKLKEVKLQENITTTLKIKCTKQHFTLRVLILFVFSGFDVSINLWMSTYLQEYLGYRPEVAGIVMALYFGSVMIGRFLIGILSEKFKLYQFIMYGLIISIVGVSLIITSPNEFMTFMAISLIGVGMCVVYPFTLFENHILYEKDMAQTLTSYQIAVNLIGSLILPFLVRLVITYVSIYAYVYIQLLFLGITFLIRLYLNKEY